MPLIIPAHTGRCLHVKHLLHHSPACDYQTRQVQYAASHLWWRLHIPLSLRHDAIPVSSAMAGVTVCRIQPSAFGSPGISRTLLVSHRYFSQFQVVSKMDDPFPSLVEWSWKAFERQRPQVAAGTAANSTLECHPKHHTAVCTCVCVWIAQRCLTSNHWLGWGHVIHMWWHVWINFARTEKNRMETSVCSSLMRR